MKEKIDKFIKYLITITKDERDYIGEILNWMTKQGQRLCLLKKYLRKKMNKQIVFRNKTRKEKLRIAKMAYKEIKHAIDNWQDSSGIVCAHWDECITVDGEFFMERELKEEDEQM